MWWLWCVDVVSTLFRRGFDDDDDGAGGDDDDGGNENDDDDTDKIENHLRHVLS